MTQWIFDTETSIFARLKNEVIATLKSTYPDIFFTMEEQISSSTRFPTVYIHFLGGTEQGGDLEGTTINAINCTVQFEVVVSNAQGMSGARKVTNEIVKQLKKMRFAINSLPEFQNINTDTKRMVGRARRIIGQGDVL